MLIVFLQNLSFSQSFNVGKKNVYVCNVHVIFFKHFFFFFSNMTSQPDILPQCHKFSYAPTNTKKFSSMSRNYSENLQILCKTFHVLFSTILIFLYHELFCTTYFMFIYRKGRNWKVQLTLKLLKMPLWRWFWCRAG